MDVLKLISDYDTTIENLSKLGEFSIIGDTGIYDLWLDWDMEFDIWYKDLGKYYVVFVESFDSRTTSARLFSTEYEGDEIDRKILFSSSYVEDEYFRCIYEHSVRDGKTTSLHMEPVILESDLLQYLIKEFPAFS